MQYEAKLFKLLDTYNKAFLFCADNVGSKQFMDVRAVRSLFLLHAQAPRTVKAHGLPFLDMDGRSREQLPLGVHAKGSS
jgi:hypothetical protein